MPRRVSRPLSARRVATVTEPGLYADGDGLYLAVSPGGVKSWIFRFMRAGRARKLGLGPVRDVSLARARDKARALRDSLRDGGDPHAEREAQRLALRLEATHSKTFSECSKSYISANAAGWSNAKHVEQWRSTLATYADPVIGKLPVADIDVALVLKVLNDWCCSGCSARYTEEPKKAKCTQCGGTVNAPLWTAKTETATRVRQRIEKILDYAKTLNYRTGDNPAAWRGNLENLLPNAKRLARVEHHAALPFADVHAFIVELRAEVGIAARALEFAILTATRTNEVINARWSEINGAVWTIPAERMKSGKEHRVPLTASALAILDALHGFDHAFVFPGPRAGTPLSNMAMLKLLKRMQRTDLTVHGFRSTFRDWCAETTNYPRDVAEMALAHTIKDNAEAAYRRGDMFEKRARLMADWCAYIDTAPVSDATVTPIRRRG